jgi:hypothetical protein
MNNRRDLLEFFRRGKSHVALVASVKPDGVTEHALNITVSGLED